jgi:hypothetical protein
MRQLISQATQDDKLMLLAIPNENNIVYSKHANLLFNKNLWVVA